MAQKWLDVYYCASVLLLTCMCIESAVAQQSNVIPISSFYELVNVSDIDNGAIAATYTKVRSKVSCGVKCSGIAAKSFFFVSNSSKCHCNTLWIDHAAFTVAQSNITYGKLKQDIYSDCQEIYMLGIRTNGTYTVRIGNETTDVYCDLSDGGWTVFQRRFDGSVDFNNSWTDYVNGFGNLDGEFWLGLETVHQLTKNGCELLILLEARQNSIYQETGFAKYSQFSLGNSTSGYTLNIGGWSGNVEDALRYHNGHKFSTFDMDNTLCPGCGLEEFSGGWWFVCCGDWDSKLNEQYFSEEYTCQGIIWLYYTWGCEPLARTEMMFRCNM